MGAATSLVGQTIAGRFRIERAIGEGAMAVVYRGKALDGGADVAVKVMQADLESDPTFVARFKREARAAAKLDHPNTVRILDFGEAEGRLYMVMELLEGKDLFDTLKQGGALPADRAVRLMIQVCRALEAAHALGIVHRDLKPENVFLLDRDERVKVVDFGIAKILERDDAPPSSSEEQLTTVGMVVGTPEYMSPEQCMGWALDARSDIYACGIVLYQMLTRRPPFYGNSQLAIAIAHMEQEAPKLGAVLPGIDPRLEAAVSRCLAKLPEERFQTATALREALEPLADGRAAALPKSRPPEAEAPLSRAVLSRQPIQAPTSGPLSLRVAGHRQKVPSRPNPPPQPAAPRPAPPRPAAGRRAEAPGDAHDDAPASITSPNLAPFVDLTSTLASVAERRSLVPRIEVIEAPPPVESQPRTSELAQSVDVKAPLAVDMPSEDGPSTRRSIPFPAVMPPAEPELVPAWKLVALAVFVGVAGGTLAYVLLRG